MNRNGYSPPNRRVRARRHEWGFGATWSHWISFLLGLMLFVAPWALGYARNMPALALSLFLGPLMCIFAFLGLIAEPESGWSRRMVFLVGLLAFCASFALRPDIPRPAASTLAILGGLALLVSVAGMLSRPARQTV